MIVDQINRFMVKVHYDDSTCWLWTAAQYGNGYGAFFDREAKGNVLAHIWSYKYWNGPIEDGMDLHHTCGIKHCVNPEHLVPITRSEHASLRRKEFCPQGHEYTVDNSYWYGNNRKCKQCRRESCMRSHYKYRNVRLEKMKQYNRDVIGFRKPGG